VAFTGKAACRLIDDDKKVGLDRRLLKEPFSKVLKQLVGAEAKRRQVEPVDILIEQASRTMTPRENDACDECGERIRAEEPSMVNHDHAESCSLYPSGDAPA
jgi:hypothetical protein